MYYPQQSPGIAHKLPTHHEQNPWSRTAHHPGVMGPPGPPPASPGYAVYTNGAMGAMQAHHPGHHPHQFTNPSMQHHTGHPQHNHHHQGSMSHFQGPSPPNGHAHQQHVMGQTSPGSTPGQMVQHTQHWQQQLLKCEMIRASRSPHHRARASAMASRTVAKSAIPITNPNTIKPATELPKEGEASGSTDDSPIPGNATAHHPSSTVAPIAETPNRPQVARRPENNWNSLDMGGVHIKNIPPTSGLFSFTFLVNLYLNHNALTTVPPEIAKLRHLELLDLSGNNLATVPPELGMLVQLKELYLFDNHLTQLPHELGTLHQLQTLGIEGNPLDASLKAIVQKDGTPALVAYLRDSCPIPAPPPERTWRQLISAPEREAIEADPAVEIFSVLCYNILWEKAATEKLYGYTPSWALSWGYRKELILTEVMNYDADFLCLQEVDLAQYEEYFTQHLKAQDYEGVYQPRSRFRSMDETNKRSIDGQAIFYKKSKYTLVETHVVEFATIALQREDFRRDGDMFNRVMGKDHISLICCFENLETGTRFIVVNAHLYWGPSFSDVKVIQVALLLEELAVISDNFARYPPRRPAGPDERPAPTYTDGTKIPLIVAGDFNSIPGSGVYELLANGNLPPDHPDFLTYKYGRYTDEGGGIRHRFGLKSAYAGIGEMPMTNFVSHFQGALDYIWYSAGNIGVNAVLGEIDKQYVEKCVGFPNAHFPSDHICLVSEFRVKPPRDTQPRSVTFPPSSH